MNCGLRYQLNWERLVLSCLLGQAISSPHKWLRSIGKEKQPDLQEGHIKISYLNPLTWLRNMVI